jgi:tyrosine-protein kinase Etk/Wzc
VDISKTQEVDPTDRDALDPVSFIEALWTQKIPIVFSTLTIAGLSVIYALLLPNIYRANAVVIPPKQSQNKYSSMVGSLASIPFMGLGGTSSGVEPLELLKAYLYKRENIFKVIAKFDLRKVYEFRDSAYKEDIVGRYRKNLKIEEDKISGLLYVTFDDEDPGRARDVVNYNLDLMQLISRQNVLTENQRKKNFVKARFDQTSSQLEAVEERIRDFFVSHNLIDVGTQTRATIEAVSRLHSELLVLNLKLKVRMELGANETHPEISSLRFQAEIITQQIRQIEKGEYVLRSDQVGEASGGNEVLAYLSLTEIPDLKLKMERLLREKMVLLEVFKTLAQEKELARLDASKDTEIVEIIERAHLPQRKVKPRRSVICIIWTLTGFLLSCFLVWMKQEFARLG